MATRNTKNGEGRPSPEGVLCLLELDFPTWLRVLVSALVMIALILVVSFFNIPNPNMILISGLVVCSSLFGVPGGVVAGAAMIGYTMYFFSTNHTLVQFDTEAAQKVLVTIVGVVIVGVFVCALKYVEARALRRTRALTSLLQSENEQLEEAVTIDELTQLRNRFALRQDYPHFAETADKLHVLVLDVDDFKGINDTYGHAWGDEALKGVGQALSKAFGAEHAYRYGGDEFLVIVPKWSKDAFVAASESAREEMLRLSVGADERKVRFSGGYVYGTPSLQADLRLMIHQADQNLYQAKASGKNVIVGGPFSREEARRPEELSHNGSTR